MAKMTGFERIELTEDQKNKIETAVNSVLDNITTDILKENGVSKQDDPDNTIYDRIHISLQAKLADKLIYNVW